MLFYDSDDYIPFDVARCGGRGLYFILAKQNGDRIHLVFNVIDMTFQAITVMPAVDKTTDIIILNDERKWHWIDKTLENRFVLFGHSFGLIIGCNGILKLRFSIESATAAPFDGMKNKKRDFMNLHVIGAPTLDIIIHAN